MFLNIHENALSSGQSSWLRKVKQIITEFVQIEDLNTIARTFAVNI
jgi:hypothetical protein